MGRGRFLFKKLGFYSLVIFSAVPALLLAEVSEGPSLEELDLFLVASDKNQSARSARYEDYREILNYYKKQNPDTWKLDYPTQDFIDFINKSADPILFVTGKGEAGMFLHGKINIWHQTDSLFAIQSDRPFGSLEYKGVSSGAPTAIDVADEERFYIFVSKKPPEAYKAALEDQGVDPDALTFLYMIPPDFAGFAGERIPLLAVPLPEELAQKGIRPEDLLNTPEFHPTYRTLVEAQRELAQNQRAVSPGLEIPLANHEEKTLQIPLPSLQLSQNGMETLWLLSMLLANSSNDDKLQRIFEYLEEDRVRSNQMSLKFLKSNSPWVEKLLQTILETDVPVPDEAASLTRMRAGGVTSRASRAFLRMLRASRATKEELLQEEAPLEEAKQEFRERTSKFRAATMASRFSGAVGKTLSHLAFWKKNRTPGDEAEEAAAEEIDKITKGAKFKRAVKRFFSFSTFLKWLPPVLVGSMGINLIVKEADKILPFLGGIGFFGAATVATLWFYNKTVNSVIDHERQKYLGENAKGEKKRLSLFAKMIRKKVLASKRTENLSFGQFLVDRVAPAFTKFLFYHHGRALLQIVFPNYIDTRQAGGRGTWRDGGLRLRGVDSIQKLLVKLPFLGLLLAPHWEGSEGWAAELSKRHHLIQINRIVEPGIGRSLLKLQIAKALDLGVDLMDIPATLAVHRRPEVQMKHHPSGYDKQTQKALRNYSRQTISLATRSSVFKRTWRYAEGLPADLSLEEKRAKVAHYSERLLVAATKAESRFRKWRHHIDTIMEDFHHSVHRVGDGSLNLSKNGGDLSEKVRYAARHGKDKITSMFFGQSLTLMMLANWSVGMSPSEFFTGGAAVGYSLVLGTSSDLATSVVGSGANLNHLFDETVNKDPYWKSFFQSFQHIHWDQILLQTASWFDMRFWSKINSALLFAALITPVDVLAASGSITDFSKFATLVQSKAQIRLANAASISTLALATGFPFSIVWRIYLATRMRAGGIDPTMHKPNGDIDEEATYKRTQIDQVGYLYWGFMLSFIYSKIYGELLPPLTQTYLEALGWESQTDNLNRLMAAKALEASGDPEHPLAKACGNILAMIKGK